MASETSDIELRIDDVAFGGDGVARAADGRVVFVPFAAVGDRLSVRVTATHARYSRGIIADILEAGPGRTLPRCPHYGRCGGCVYQHLDYSTETGVKTRQLGEQLRRVARLEEWPEPEAVEVSPRVYGYRNKLRVEPVLQPAEDPKDRLLGYGYCECDNATFFALDACPLAQDALNDMLSRAPRSQLGKRNASSARPSPLTVRVTGDGATAFYFGRAPKRIPWLHEKLLGRDVSVPLGAFWQVNPEVADRLVETVAGWFRDDPTRTLIDAYSGVGTFSLAVGDAAGTRFLIENDEQALMAAEHNHTQWGNLSCHSRHGRTEHALPHLLEGCNLKRTTVLLDPPRQGCAPRVIRGLCDFGPVQVIYVSCNAGTLARDLRELGEKGGYRLQRVALFDMFPRTAHFETAVLLKRG